MGRVQQAKKNVFFGYVGNLIILVMGFIQRTVFIYVLGETLLSVNGLYTDILTMLSVAELGIGTAMNFALYKPVATGDKEKIKSFMRLYKKAYLFIGLAIAVAGIALSPFLKYLVKDPGIVTLRELTIYYFIFLFNTVSSYFVTYKYSLANAEQKNYIQTNIQTITKIVTVIVQVIVLLAFKNFLLFLISQAVVELLQKIFVSCYFNKLYPYLRDKEVAPLEPEERSIVWTKVRALVLHRVGDMARLQTDSIIISSVIDTNLVGRVGNYNYILTYAANFINVIFTSLISGLGNLVATESTAKQHDIFKVYRFFGCWMFGFATVGCWFLLDPFIGGIWLNSEWQVSFLVIGLILTDFYFKGERSILQNYKVASGIFEQDKWLPIVQGLVNLVISIVLAYRIGLAGVYIGTVISGLIGNIVKPIVIYRASFNLGAKEYFIDSSKYLAVILGIMGVLYPIKRFLLGEFTILGFILLIIAVTVIYNGAFLLFFGRTAEYRYVSDMIKRRIKR